MVTTPSIQTVTMARVLEGQGKYHEALTIYRQLLLEDPGQDEIAAAVERVQTALGMTTDQQVRQLFDRWLDLLIRQMKFNRLTNLNHFIINGGHRQK